MVQLEKRDRGIMCFVIFLFAFQFIAISFVSTSITGWSQTTELDYNVTDHYEGADYLARFTTYNATSYAFSDQTKTFDNDTKDVIVASAVLNEVSPSSGMTHASFSFRMNSTFLAVADVTRIVIAYQYVGFGNVTGIELQRLTPSPTKTFYTTPTATNPANNGSIIWTAEAFEAAQLKLVTKIHLSLLFNDASNLPVDADYVQISLKFYEATLLLTQEQILQGLAGCIGITWFVVGAAVSPFWNPRRKRRGGR